jgi:hypothetical protein
MRTPALIALASLFALPLTAGAEIYSWKDASGKIHYADKPPLEKKVTTRELKSGRTTGGEATPAPAPAASPKAAEGGAADGGAAAGNGQGKSLEQAKAEADARQQLCDNARKRLIQLESEQGIILTKNAKGEQTPLVGDARKAETEAARKDVEQWCK